MFSLFRKKPKQIPRKLYVPENMIEGILSAWDDFSSIETKGNKLLRYRFWKLVADVFPETKQGSWVFVSTNGLKPYFLELLDDND